MAIVDLAAAQHLLKPLLWGEFLYDYGLRIVHMVRNRCCYITVDSVTTAMVLTHVGAFPNKSTIKHPFYTTAA